MTPNLPIAALPILGPDLHGLWGGVPWHDGVRHAEPLQGMRDGSVTLFPYRQQKPVLQITCANNDLDGAGGSKKADPSYEPDTTLRLPGGGDCDSRKFPGVVISPAMREFGIKVGDFCLVTWNGKTAWAQVYDMGPRRKEGEFSIYLVRQLGLVRADQTDRHAAICGHDAQDVATLIFPGSGPGHALPPDQIVTGARACWGQFTGRKEGA